MHKHLSAFQRLLNANMALTGNRPQMSVDDRKVAEMSYILPADPEDSSGRVVLGLFLESGPDVIRIVELIPENTHTAL